MSASWADGPVNDWDLWAQEIEPDPYDWSADPQSGLSTSPGTGVPGWQADDGSGLTVDDDREPGLLLRGLFYAGMFQLAGVAAVAGVVFAGYVVVRWLVGA